MMCHEKASKAAAALRHQTGRHSVPPKQDILEIIETTA
jgi:hypothetical protein